MIKITDTPEFLGLTSLKQFECPHCRIMVTFRTTSQVICYKCGKPLIDVNNLLSVLTTRILYYNNQI